MTELNEESVVECVVCSTDIDPDNAYETESCETVCSDCVRSCDNCAEVGTENDDYSTVDGWLWCENCVSNHASWCESCEEYTSESTNYVADRDSHWCDNCVSGSYWCDDCSQYYEQGYCDDCQDSRLIHDYQYRPDPVFHSTKGDERLFFGIEVEVEAGRNISDASEYAQRLEVMDIAYLKSDGSLTCGFEVVTHPMSHDYYKNEVPELYDTLTKLRTNYGVKSWGTSTCGVHVHISRTGFNGGAHMHRFLNLVYSNQEFYEVIAGRSSDRWAKFDDVNRYDSKGNQYRAFARKLSPNRANDRYSAVNTNNTSTLELRIFKGSTQTHVLKSYIDLAHASVEYTRSLSIQEVKNGALTVEPFVQYIFDNSELYPELVERTSRLFVDMSASRQEVSA